MGLDTLDVLVRSLVMNLMLVVWSMTIALSPKVILSRMQIPLGPYSLICNFCGFRCICTTKKVNYGS